MNIPEGVPSDPRNPDELAADWADQQIADFLLDIDFLQVEGDSAFTRDDVLDFIRAAWVNGAIHGADFPLEMHIWFNAFATERRRILEEKQK